MLGSPQQDQVGHAHEQVLQVCSPKNGSAQLGPNCTPGSGPCGQGGAGPGLLVAPNHEGNGQPKRPTGASNQLQGRDEATKRPSTFSYAAAAAGRGKGPSATTLECEQYRALAKKARSSPRVLSIKLQKPPVEGQGRESPLDQAQWGDIIFNACGIDPKDIKGIDFEAGGQLNCEVMLVDGANLDKYAGKSGSFMGRAFNTAGPAEAEVTISFKGIALSVPDLEIIHLLKSYGYKPSESGVQHSPVSVTSSNPEVGCKAEVSTTRSIKAVPPTSRRLRSFYWWAGMLESDPPRRVTVDHKGKGPRQCAHCLKGPQDPFPCPFNGKSSACRKHNPAGRTSLAQYSKMLREQDGYSPLKSLMLISSPSAEEEVVEEEEVDQVLRVLEEVTTQLDQPGSWVDEPRTFTPEKDREDLENQVLSLTKKLAEAERSAKEAKYRSRKHQNQLTQANKEAAESRHGVRLTRDYCVSRLRELLPEEGNSSWDSNTECLTSMLAATTKLSNFTLSEEENLTIIEGKSPWDELRRDVSSLPNQAKALKRVEEVIEGAQEKIKSRMLFMTNNRSRSVSRGREPDPDDLAENSEAKSAKIQEPKPASPEQFEGTKPDDGTRDPGVEKEPVMGPEVQEGPKKMVPGDPGDHPGPNQNIGNWLSAQGAKRQGSSLKIPLSRPGRSGGKGDSKITKKAQQ